MSDAPVQLPPADELHAVREQRKALKSREDELRALMLSDPSARTGNAFAAEIREVTISRTDIVEMRKMHPALVDEYTFPAKVMQVVLVGISGDGELIPARRVKSGEAA